MFDVKRLVIPEVSDTRHLLRLSRARKYSQYVGMLANLNDCIFCRYPRDKIILFNDTFQAWHCAPPEENTALHIIFAPKRHVTRFRDFTQQEQLDWFDIRRQIEDRFNLSSEGILARDNAVEMAGTIEHHHTHAMTGNGKGRVESPFCKGEAADNASLEKAIVFEKIRQMILGTVPPMTVNQAFQLLCPTDQALVVGKLD